MPTLPLRGFYDWWMNLLSISAFSLSAASTIERKKLLVNKGAISARLQKCKSLSAFVYLSDLTCTVAHYRKVKRDAALLKNWWKWDQAKKHNAERAAVYLNLIIIWWPTHTLPLLLKLWQFNFFKCFCMCKFYMHTSIHAFAYVSFLFMCVHT